MNNKYLLSLIFVLLTQALMSQEQKNVVVGLQAFNNDTGSYIKQYIIARKATYVGKPLDSLLKDLPAVMEYVNFDIPRNRYLFPSTSFFFSSSTEVLRKLDKKEFPQLVSITWAIPLDNREFQILGVGFWGGKWIDSAYNYYKSKIIGNIETVEYNYNY